MRLLAHSSLVEGWEGQLEEKAKLVGWDKGGLMEHQRKRK